MALSGQRLQCRTQGAIEAGQLRVQSGAPQAASSQAWQALFHSPPALQNVQTAPQAMSWLLNSWWLPSGGSRPEFLPPRSWSSGQRVRGGNKRNGQRATGLRAPRASPGPAWSPQETPFPLQQAAACEDLQRKINNRQGVTRENTQAAWFPAC